MSIAAIPSIPGLNSIAEATAPGGAGSTAGGTSFSNLLANKLGSVVDLQNQADSAAQAIATGQSSDLAGATVSVEKASIAMQLVGAVRNQAVGAYQDVMRMQV